MSVTLQLGHSPDSDDAFMFYGLASGRVQAPGLQFKHILKDIQTLNDWALEGRLECTAISVHAYAYVREKYAILTHGASMGDGYGPTVVAAKPIPLDELRKKTIAIPGLKTSAHLALGIWFGGDYQHVTMPFDRIMEAVSSGEVEAGLIIHEGQLTHSEAGLECLLDLGKWWKDRFQLPLPLGVNAIRSDLDIPTQSAASRALRESIQFSLSHREEALEHALRYARDMDVQTADRFVGMYVNDWTLDLGERGKKSIELFLRMGAEVGLIPPQGPVVFVS